LKKGANWADTVSDLVDNGKTVLDQKASTGDRVIAGLSLASEILPVSVGDATDVYKGGKKLLGIADGAGDVKKVSTLTKGPYAKQSIPAKSKDKTFTKDERDQVNEIGRTDGCHTCGNTDPGTKSGNFIPDHQPPSALVPDNTPQELLAHCKTCSAKQGGDVRVEKQKRNKQQNEN
jgi:hypothetical protein